MKVATDCVALAWIRDIADATKHRALNRASVQVAKFEQHTKFVGSFNTYAFNTMPFNEGYQETLLVLDLDDGTKVNFADALSSAIVYWNDEHFA